MAYVLLGAAILAEVIGTLFLRAAVDRPALGVVVAAGYLAAFALLALALGRGLPLSIAYALWAGIGVALVAGLSVPLFGEALSALQLGGIALVIAGVVAIELGTSH